MANWRKIRKLYEHLASRQETSSRKFSMREFVRLISGEYKDGDLLNVRQIRRNGPTCGTAACLAGEAFLRFAPASTELRVRDMGRDGLVCKLNLNAVQPYWSIEEWAEKELGLEPHEAGFMFYGNFSKHRATATTLGARLNRITRREALTYLRHAIKQQNILVDWRGRSMKHSHSGGCGYKKGWRLA